MSESVVARPTGLFSAFAGLLSSQLLNTASGFLFWLVAARLAPTREVGIAVAAIGAITLVNKLAMMGIDTLILVEIPLLGDRDARRLIRVALAVVAAASMLLSLVLWAVVHVVVAPGSALLESLSRPSDMALVAGIQVATTMGVLCDGAAIGLRRTSTQVTRNAIASLGRFPTLVLVVWLGDRDADEILIAWFVPIVVSLVVFAVQNRLGMRASRTGRASLRELVRGHWRTAFGHFGVSLALAAGPLLVPVVAAALLAPTENAYFAIAWMVATVVFVPPYMLATALFASSASRGVRSLAHSARISLPGGLLLSGILALGAWVGGPLLLRIFSHEYGEQSAHILALLAPAGLWMVVKDHLVAWMRVEKLLGRAAALAVLATLIELGAAILGGLWHGPTGLALFWLLSGLVEAVLAAGLIAGFLRLIRREGAVRGPTVMVSSGVVGRPVEGAQVVAGQVARHIGGSHGGVLLTSPTPDPPTDLVVEDVYTTGWLPVEALRRISELNPQGVVFLPHGGLNAKTLLHAVLFSLAASCRVDLIVLQLHRQVPRLLGRVLRRRIRMVAGNAADREALSRSGFATSVITPRVDPDRVSTASREAARAEIGLPADGRIALHVGHARQGRNLLALAPLAEDGVLVIVASPYSPLDETAVPPGPGVRLVHARVDVSLYYRAADVYVFPVVQADHVIAFPMSIAEALANDLRVVARRTPMTERWAGHPGVALVDSDQELVDEARATTSWAVHLESGSGASPLSICASGCAL